jgi:hypothetical protein
VTVPDLRVRGALFRASRFVLQATGELPSRMAIEADRARKCQKTARLGLEFLRFRDAALVAAQWTRH